MSRVTNEQPAGNVTADYIIRAVASRDSVTQLQWPATPKKQRRGRLITRPAPSSVFRRPPQEDPPSIAPNVLVPNLAADYFALRDPVLERILR